MESCKRKTEYKLTDWNQIDLYKQKAKDLASELEPSLTRGEKISWNGLKEICLMNTTLWKFLLKEFRSRGYSIGDSKNQFLAKKMPV